ncbi:hypothetical protein EV360DRAFT_77089 [Lentinula raphanica]|nr:hypothetical protein EV360DRAFT_77089 [Lentinula raphanica]
MAGCKTIRDGDATDESELEASHKASVLAQCYAMTITPSLGRWRMTSMAHYAQGQTLFASPYVPAIFRHTDAFRVLRCKKEYSGFSRGPDIVLSGLNAVQLFTFGHKSPKTHICSMVFSVELAVFRRALL